MGGQESPDHIECRCLSQDANSACVTPKSEPLDPVLSALLRAGEGQSSTPENYLHGSCIYYLSLPLKDEHCYNPSN